MLTKTVRTLKVAIAAIVLSLTAAGAAYAVTQNPPEGGEWSYGTGWATGWAWSYYTHPSQGHGSSLTLGGLNGVP